ncbi:MAG: hypothetical protein ACR2PL_06420 [Dehalococcoidia bacterium]
MRNNGKGLGWLAFLAPVLVCVPCRVAPLAIAGGTAFFAAVGGVLTGNLWLVAGILPLCALAAGGLYLRVRPRGPVVCDTPPLPQAAEPSYEAATQIRQPGSGVRSER